MGKGHTTVKLFLMLALVGARVGCSSPNRSHSAPDAATDADTDTDTDTDGDSDSDWDPPTIAVPSIIDGGERHTCLLSDGGGVVCWGADDFGQLGDGDGESGPGLVAVAGLPLMLGDLQVGEEHACAMIIEDADKGTDELFCWGRVNTEGHYIDDAIIHWSAEPVPSLDEGVASQAAGDLMHYAVTDTGQLKAWGNNRQGQLGDGTLVDHIAPEGVME